ncbi:MAG: hypothetical protein ACOZF0_22445 [Thermodesulfobacteriota bacterium]
MRMKATIGLLIVMLIMTATAMASDVVQGECIEFKDGVIKLKEFDTHFSPEAKYGRPTEVESEYDVKEAEIGMSPEPGDILRIAYKVEGTSRVAHKVMNVSKQDLMKK